MSDMTTVLVKGIIMTIILITDLGHRMADWLSTVTQVAMHVHAQPKFQLTMHTFLEKQISKHNMGNKASGILIFSFFHHSSSTMALESSFYDCCCISKRNSSCHSLPSEQKACTHLCFCVMRRWTFRKAGLQIQKLSIHI